MDSPQVAQFVGSNTGQSTLDRKNRKKRAAKALSPDKEMPKVEVDRYVEHFYNLFLRTRCFKSNDS
jgi:hypothetical protein